MCATCGCGDVQGEHHPHDHAHGHDDGHGHGHGHESDAEHTRTLTLERDILAKNNLIAERNRGWLDARSVVALNLMSSPGAGKTTLLERTIARAGSRLGITVIEGDQATANDADRIQAAGARAVQINTGTGCHLDAQMLAGALRTLDPAPRSLVIIENVGNLVCPAEFRVGEDIRAMVCSVAEGDDKPLKYPLMFRAADLVVVNKLDLLPHVDADLDRLLHHLDAVHPGVERMVVSAKTVEGIAEWRDWLARVGRPVKAPA
jgi:hydrogenase nickel incorporation protein HypB